MPEPGIFSDLNWLYRREQLFFPTQCFGFAWHIVLSPFLLRWKYLVRRILEKDCFKTMSANQIELNRPIRVVMFGSGPELNPDAKQFLCRLEEHPEIEFLGAFCQAQSQSLRAVFADLWKRRGWLAFPLFIIWVTNKAMRFLLHPREEIALQRSLEKISDRIHFVARHSCSRSIGASVCTGARSRSDLW